jgi:hypothetical protein
MARKAASGHPNPLEELTVTTAPSGISSPIFSREIILDRAINELLQVLSSGSARLADNQSRLKDHRAGGGIRLLNSFEQQLGRRLA